jgi:hypothetical protein
MPALCDYDSSTIWTSAQQSTLRLATHSIDSGEFHLISPHDQSMPHRRSIEPLFETHAKAHQLFVAGSCFSSALARGSLSLVVK